MVNANRDNKIVWLAKAANREAQRLTEGTRMALAADTTGKCVVSCGRKRTSRVLMTFWHALKLSCLNTFFVADLSHHYDDVDSNSAAAAPTARLSRYHPSSR